MISRGDKMTTSLFSICSNAKRGNSYVLKQDNDFVFLDAGFNKTQLFSAIERHQLDVSNIKGVVLTHHHESHTKGLKFLLELKDDIKIYGSKDTLEILPFSLKQQEIIHERRRFKVGNILFFPFPVKHSAHTLNYVIQVEKEKIAYITNTGNIDKRLIDDIGTCNHFLIESYYHPGIARRKGTWEDLKRIVTTEGHLSNEDASEIVARCSSEQVKNIFIINVSDYNNRNLAYLMMQSLFEENTINIHLMPPNEVSEMVALSEEMNFMDMINHLSAEEQRKVFEKLLMM